MAAEQALTDDFFARLLQQSYIPSASHSSQVSERLGAPSTADAIRTIAQADRSTYRVTDSGAIEFDITMKAKGETVTQKVTVSLEHGAGGSVDAAQLRVQMAPLTQNGTYEGMWDEKDKKTIDQNARIEINRRVRALGLEGFDVGQVSGRTLTNKPIEVDQSALSKDRVHGARAKVAEDVRQGHIGQQAVDEATIRHIVAPAAVTTVDELIKLDPKKDPQAFAIKLKEMGLDKDIDFLKVTMRDEGELKKLHDIHAALPELRHKLATNPVGEVQEIQRRAAGDTDVQRVLHQDVGAPKMPPSLGEAAKNLAGALGRKLPLIGAGVVGTQMALATSGAQAAHAEGHLSDEQLAAVVVANAGIEGCAVVASAPVVGTVGSLVCEEAIEKKLADMKVPEQFRPGTTSQALDGLMGAIARTTQPYREAGQKREAEQREKDQWRTGQTELTVVLSGTEHRANTKKILDTLKEIRGTDRAGAAALQQAMLKHPEQAESILNAYQQAQAAGIGRSGERHASGEVGQAERTPAYSPPVRSGEAVASHR